MMPDWRDGGTFMSTLYIGPGTGGGGGGQRGRLSFDFWTGGALPLQLWTVDVVHFFFCR